MNLVKNITQNIVENRTYPLVENLRRWGGPTTDAILDPSCKLFSTPEIEGFIGYRLESNYAVVLGDPVCAPSDKPLLAQAFCNYCSSNSLEIIYVIVSEEFARWAMQNNSNILVEYGSKLILNPQSNPINDTGEKASLVRRKMKHAQREGITVNEYFSGDEPLEQAIEQVGEEWLKSRKGPQIHISNAYLFDHRYGKRWFYAKKENRVVGVLVLNQLQARNGWLLNHVMFTPGAPGGTPEMLVVKALETLEKEGNAFVMCGTIPSNHLGEVRGLNKFSVMMTRTAFEIAKRIFHLDGHRMFWDKFHPKTEKAYLLFNQKRIGLGALKALFRTFNASWI